MRHILNQPDLPSRKGAVALAWRGNATGLGGVLASEYVAPPVGATSTFSGRSFREHAGHSSVSLIPRCSRASAGVLALCQRGIIIRRSVGLSLPRCSLALFPHPNRRYVANQGLKATVDKAQKSALLRGDSVSRYPRTSLNNDHDTLQYMLRLVRSCGVGLLYSRVEKPGLSRHAHNVKFAGSNPAPATIYARHSRASFPPTRVGGCTTPRRAARNSVQRESATPSANGSLNIVLPTLFVCQVI